MSITVYTYNDKVLKNVATDKWLRKKPGLPPIPANTLRVRTNDGNEPNHGYYDTITPVTGTTDVYDLYTDDFTTVLYGATNVVEILGANLGNSTNLQALCAGCTALTAVALFDTSNVTDMCYMFSGCSSLTSVPLFDTSNVTDMSYMFKNCTSLTTIPLFDTSSVGITDDAFKNCTNVQSGALALYNQMTTQANPPYRHVDTFYNCGSNTITGAAELAQIPTYWGGTAP